jgi:hypothetical protein
MLEDLAPTGVVETMLAQRVVGLSWRLRRAERLQNAAFAALDDGEPTPLLKARHEEWKQLKGSEWERGLAGLFDEDAALGKVVVEDFGGARVLDSAGGGLMYERRIESPPAADTGRWANSAKSARHARRLCRKQLPARRAALRRIRKSRHRRNWLRLARTWYRWQRRVWPGRREEQEAVAVAMLVSSLGCVGPSRRAVASAGRQPHAPRLSQPKRATQPQP